MIILLFFINFKSAFADFPNTKFWFPEFFSSYTWHVTLLKPLTLGEHLQVTNYFFKETFEIEIRITSDSYKCYKS